QRDGRLDEDKHPDPLINPMVDSKSGERPKSACQSEFAPLLVLEQSTGAKYEKRQSINKKYNDHGQWFFSLKLFQVVFLADAGIFRFSPSGGAKVKAGQVDSILKPMNPGIFSH
ncbi:MAG: hypothetical protein M0Z75_17780, partial [Nitrospiraceae bacterium]|nr:hypothetical protein [Nitrospiraceae bacterium]